MKLVYPFCMQEISLHALEVVGWTPWQAKALWSSLAKLKHLRKVLIEPSAERDLMNEHFFLESVSHLTQIK
jgi:hypothetical protein